MTMTKGHINKNKALREALQKSEAEVPKSQTFSQWLSLMEWMICEMRNERKKTETATPDDSRMALAAIMQHAAWLSVSATRLLNDIMDNLNATVT